jgi:hypothetical protein
VSRDPGFTLNTPREICSTRRAMPKACMGARLSVLRINMSSVPWMTSVLGSSMDVAEKGILITIALS